MTMRIAFGVAIAICALAFTGCGGGDISSSQTPPESPTPTPASTLSGRAVVEAGVSSVTSAQTTIETLEQVIQDRLGDAGVHSDISQTSDAELTIHFTGARSFDFVKQVIEAKNLNFRQPIINTNGDVTCGDESGTEFFVPASNLHEARDDLGNDVEACVASDGRPGSLHWQPAQADVNGVKKTLLQSTIDVGQAEITLSPQVGPELLLKFDEQGTAVFAAVTAHLVNHPLGIFLGDTLLTAPTVQSQISNGEAEITGQSDDELAAARAVLRGGELPVPVTVTSIDLDSPAP